MNRNLLIAAPLAAVLLAGCVAEDTNHMRAQELGAEYVAGNPTCADLGLGSHEYKIESFGETILLFDGFNTITITPNVGAGTLDWTSTLGIDAVIMKGGPNALVYEYDPEAFSDTGLQTPHNDNSGGPYGISHVSFCYDYELTVEKTASTSFTRTHEWDITKSVDPAEHQLTTGEIGSSTYDVTVTHVDAVDSDFAASGTVTVTNQTPFIANLKSITDELSNGTAVTLECDTTLPTTLGSGEAVNCTYELALADGTNLVNNATAEVLPGSPVEGGEASAAVDFASADITEVNDSVNIEDDFEGVISQLGEVSGTQTFTYDRGFTCDDEGLSYNTASIVETGQNDTAVVRVVCAHSGAEGCTPGYWKNHDKAWEMTPYAQGDAVVDVFSEASAYVNNKFTLEQALKGRGGNRLADAARILLRAAVAGLLDASHPGVSYPISAAELIARTNAALASADRDEILRVKDIIDQYNNLGCPL